ncbi:MAG: hypothetical protein KDI36_08820 [Pseudomonadales bacterium]|nr:hypothetical protein [Pseudomonadales bacterium]
MSGLRADLGAVSNGLTAQADQLLSQQVTDAERLSGLQDTDYAEELTNLIKEELQFKAQVSVFNRQRMAEESIISLLTQ